MIDALPVLLFLGSIIVQIVMALAVWLLLRPMQSKLERLANRVETEQERRLSNIEADLKEVRHDHDEQIRIDANLRSMEKHMDGKFDELKILVSRLADGHQATAAKLVSHDGQLTQHQARLDGLHNEIRKMRPAYLRAGRTGTEDNQD